MIKLDIVPIIIGKPEKYLVSTGRSKAGKSSLIKDIVGLAKLAS